MDGLQDYRYERKFLVRDMTLEELSQVVRLHPAVFYPIHHPRWINNIYLDSPALKSFSDNVEGVGHRTKFRIRWYGDLQGDIPAPMLEIKRKWGYLSKKELIPIPEFNFEEVMLSGGVMELLQSSTIPAETRNELMPCQPALVNRYHRSYYLSADGHYRVTLDSQLKYYPIHLPFPELLEQEARDAACILELKYDSGQDDGAKDISSEFQFRLTKSSKYVSGVIQVFPAG